MAIAPIAAVSLAATAASAAVGGYSAIASSEAAASNANYQAQVARNNQMIADQNAVFATEQGQQQSLAKQQQTAQQISGERAATAASGIDPNTGSSVRIQGSTAALGALDAQTITNNAARTAWGYKNQGMDFGAEAGLLQQQSSQASAAGALGAFSSIIGGASSVSSKWTQFNLNGVTF
jgi:hypothetical protein